MKISIELSIDSSNMSEKEAKRQLVEKLYNLCNDWMKGDDMPFITFSESKEEDLDNLAKYLN